ncbi:MAG: hypothetical protein OEV95_12405 [Gemmatimonadota bacterium]|jgi:hypothetical protein|nr:hypothetical protein [Gemmatimonadota bacterium]
MVFVPVVVPPQRAASARAQDLGRRLKMEIEKFETQYPGTSREDLRAAAAIAIGEESVTTPPRRRIAAALVAGIIGLGVAASFIGSGSAAGGDAARWPILTILIAVAAFGVVAAVIRRSRR